MRKNLLRRILAASVALGSFTFTPNFCDFNFMPVAFAQVETYEGVGEYIMSKKETPEFAEKSAKGYALRNAQEQAGYFLKNLSIVKNNHLEEEMMVVSANIVREIESVPVLIPLSGANSGYIKCRVTVKVQIDTDELKNEIDKILKRDVNERSDLVEKNKLLQKMLDDANKRNAELEKLIANAKTDNDKINSEISMVENDAQVIEKIAEGNKLSYEQKYNQAIDSYGNAMKTKIYEVEGEGRYTVGEFDTIDLAKERARDQALTHVIEKIGISLTSENIRSDKYTIENAIEHATKNRVEIIDTRFELIFIPLSDNLQIKAIIKVKINPNEVDKWVEKMKMRGTKK